MTDFPQSLQVFFAWNFTPLLTIIAVTSVFIVDMARFKNRSLSQFGFTSASTIGLVVGVILATLLTNSPIMINLSVSVISTIAASTALALKLQTIDQPVDRKSRENHRPSAR